MDCSIKFSLLQAAFVPSSESALDTSYFTSRYMWNPLDDHAYPASEEDYSDADSVSGSSSCLSPRQEEVVLYFKTYSNLTK